MKAYQTTERKRCLKVRQLFIFVSLLIMLLPNIIYAGEVYGPTRAPANFIPNDEVGVVPYEQEIFLQNLMVEDSAGVMKSIKQDMRNWEQQEQFVKNWNIQGAAQSGIYETRTTREKRKYLMKRSLKYVDKRLAGEVKEAEEGSTLAQVGKAQKALKPSSQVAVAEKVKVKFKARVLQGKAHMIVDNPYVDYRTDVNMKGQVDMTMGKNIKQVGVRTTAKYNVNKEKLNLNATKDIKLLAITTNVNYEVATGRWVASVSKRLTDNLTAEVLSVQDDKQMILQDKSDQVARINYHLKF